MIAWPLVVYEHLDRGCLAARGRLPGSTTWDPNFALDAATPEGCWRWHCERAQAVGRDSEAHEYVIVAYRRTDAIRRGVPVYVRDWAETHDPQAIEAALIVPEVTP